MPSIADLKARMAQLNSRGAKKPQDLFKPKDVHEVRLLPLAGTDDPFITLHFHYEIGDAGTVLCPKLNFDEDCDICTFADLLKAWKGADGQDKPELERKADFEMFKKIQAKARVFVPMVERGKEDGGARWWGLTPTQVATLLEVCCDGDRLALCGLAGDDEKEALKVLIGTEKAFDLKVNFKKPGEKGNNKTFPVTDIECKVVPKPLLADKAAVAKLVGSIKPIQEVYPRVSSAEVSKIMAKFAGGAQKSEARAEGGVEYGKKPAAKNSGEDAAKVGGRSIDAAFDDMLGEKKEEAKA